MRVKEIFRKNFHEPDLEAVRAVYASVAAQHLNGQPVWLMLVGPPGSLKTVLLMSLDGLPDTHIIDQITPKTFISGYSPVKGSAPEEPSGLLFRIGTKGTIICPDFSTILAINRDHRASILSDLRRIYDGMLRKEYGTGQDMRAREWRGRITFLAAGTGDVDRHYSVFASLGERFLLIRWPRAGIGAAQLAVTQEMNIVNAEISEAVHRLFNGIETVGHPSLPFEMEQTRIPALGDFIAYCRTQVVRNSHGSREIVEVPEAESATRISQQLCQLAKGCALIERRPTVNEEDWLLVKRVAFDCMPPARRKVLDALIYKSPCEDLPETTRRYATEDLAALGVLDKSSKLSKRSMLQLETAGLV